MTEKQKHDSEDVGELESQMFSEEGSPSAFNTLRGASLRPGKLETDDS